MAVNAKNWQEMKKPNALEKRAAGGDCAPQGDLRRRAAGARLRPDARQLASPGAALVAPGRRGHLDPDRGRASRVQQPRRRARGHHRPRPQREAGRAAHGRRPAAPPRPLGHRPRRSHRRPDRHHRRHRGDEPRSGPVPSRRRRDPQHGADRGSRQRLCPRRLQPPGRRSDRDHPDRRSLQPGAPGQLQGREHPRRPGARLRQAHPDGRDRRNDHARRRRRLRRPDPPGPAAAVRPLRRQPRRPRRPATATAAMARARRRPSRTPTSSTATS